MSATATAGPDRVGTVVTDKDGDEWTRCADGLWHYGPLTRMPWDRLVDWYGPIKVPARDTAAPDAFVQGMAAGLSRAHAEVQQIADEVFEAYRTSLTLLGPVGDSGQHLRETRTMINRANRAMAREGCTAQLRRRILRRMVNLPTLTLTEPEVRAREVADLVAHRNRIRCSSVPILEPLMLTLPEEPSPGSVVLDAAGIAWQRNYSGDRSSWSGIGCRDRSWGAVLDHGPVTVLHTATPKGPDQ